jgi:hypothetical protein
MGVVYKARHLSKGIAAIKVILPDLVDVIRIGYALSSESRAAAIRHQNIIA